MKSKNDPILDLQQLCQLQPCTEEQLREGLKAFGWGLALEDVLLHCQG